jgi:hypothetical protein
MAPLETFPVLTSVPNEVMAPIHNRMPVILDRRIMIAGSILAMRAPPVVAR